MEALQVILVVILFIWSILCIILFFKVWGMCNDVSSILEILMRKEYDDVQEPTPTKQRVSTPSPTPKKKQAIVANPPKKESKTDEDNQDNMMAFNDDCLVLFKQCKSREEFENRVDEIIDKYNKVGGFDYSTLKDGLWEQFKLL